MWRKIEKDLLAWKNNPHRKPLILNGIRQCGKTYSLRKFGQEHFKEVAYFNFEEQQGLNSIFSYDFDTDRIIQELEALSGKQLADGTTLVIFDEIQESPKAITSLKYFCENRRSLHLACAGSLLGTVLNRKGFSFPVGKVDRLRMYPMSFLEFLTATDGEKYLNALEIMDIQREIPSLFSDAMKKYLHQYFIVGGMPESVSMWKETHNFSKIDKLLENILLDYESDFSKHAPLRDIPKINLLWQSVPVQIAKENNKFVFSHVKKGARAKDLEDALQWLIDAGMVYKNELVEKPGTPLSFYADATYFKVFMADIGLLRKKANLSSHDISGDNANYTRFKGAFAENYVMNELKSMGIQPYFWRSGNTAEIDFLIELNGDIIPIEVKSADNTKAKSLQIYRGTYHPRHAVKTSLKNAGINLEDGMRLYSIPLYMLWKLKKYLP